MATKSVMRPLVVIVGPTASGKTALAIELALSYDGEIICADSRTVYKGMDIGTAKPSREERALVPHWGLDLVEPGEYYSAAEFKKYTNKKIIEIRARGHTPFLIGGTGLYIDAVIFDYKFGKPADNELRLKLQQLTLEELYSHCINNNIQLPENFKNKRYIINAIEKNSNNSGGGRQKTPIMNTVIVGITTDKIILQSRIHDRSEQLFYNGVVEEATMLGKKYGWDSEAMKSNIYPLIHDYINGRKNLVEIKEKFETFDWRLAKRQITWLKRNRFIKWFDLDGARQYLNTQLAIHK